MVEATCDVLGASSKHRWLLCTLLPALRHLNVWSPLLLASYFRVGLTSAKTASAHQAHKLVPVSAEFVLCSACVFYDRIAPKAAVAVSSSSSSGKAAAEPVVAVVRK